mmetsp:Transcript_4765/g.7986  ORF Transcript_4765/g.7986 Transcript_4765/m.7986 type:complete len:229 (-) Transcript_4765:155-841(-)
MSSNQSSSLQQQSPLLTLYLGLYNILCCCGWVFILAKCVLNATAYTPHLLWGDVGWTLKVTQTVALLEIFHCYFKITKSPMSTTALQVGSRIFYVWAIFVPNTEVAFTDTAAMFSAGVLTSWGLVEVIRYSFYTVTTLFGPSRVPFFLHWLRYSAFLVLYVTGISSELGVIAVVLLDAWRRGLSELSVPEANITASVLLFAVLYLPGAPTMYGHMLKARRKQLGSKSE